MAVLDTAIYAFRQRTGLRGWPDQVHGCPVPVSVPLEEQLSRIGDSGGFGLEQAIDGPAVHQI